MYKVWKVITQTKLGAVEQYYVINLTRTKHKVQSVWKSGFEAKEVCEKLNKLMAKGA
jgi:hypothetical protein